MAIYTSNNSTYVDGSVGGFDQTVNQAGTTTAVGEEKGTGEIGGEIGGGKSGDTILRGNRGTQY